MTEKLSVEDASKLIFGVQAVIPIWTWVGRCHPSERFTKQDIYNAFYGDYGLTTINAMSSRLGMLSLIEEVPTIHSAKTYHRTEHPLWPVVLEICDYYTPADGSDNT